MNTKNTKIPLYVDLDGSLLKSDVLVESFFCLMKKNLRHILYFPLWLTKGKANLKYEIAKRADIDVTLLPYNEDLLTFLNEEKNQGRNIYLATASNIKYANQIADHIGIFDGVLASDQYTNLSGKNKLQAIQEHSTQESFDYVGNDHNDLEVWRHARKAIVISNNEKLIEETKKITEVERVFKVGAKASAHLKAIRPHQWVKNILIFLPLIASQHVMESTYLIQTIIAFFSFSFCASSVYLLNDMLDLPNDRKHPRKCNRPYASGSASIVQGALLAPVLFILSLLIALLLPVYFIVVLVIYYISTLLYSIKFKNVVMTDVLLLSGLYTIRIIAGGVAISIEPSFWLLAFSMFIFLSLAMVKRYSELHNIILSGENVIAGRGYQKSDVELLISLGGASGYLAVLVLALYINSPSILTMYTYPEVIWLLCPILLYWISRIWLVTRRGKMHDDPIVYALRDRNSRIVILLALFILLIAQ